MKTDSEKKEQVYKILLMPIKCINEKKIVKRGNTILSGQKYIRSSDPDMSDFAIGFYEIIYTELLNDETLLDNDGYLNCPEFAGDTMNSYKTIASEFKLCEETSQEASVLSEYKSKYHCLANFWILPMVVGRTLTRTFNKARNPIGDYMDKFLELLEGDSFEKFTRDYPIYCQNVKRFDEFLDYHYLKNPDANSKNYYCNEKGEINIFSNSNSAETVKTMLTNIKMRAKIISESDKWQELWEYFNKYGLTD